MARHRQLVCFLLLGLWFATKAFASATVLVLSSGPAPNAKVVSISRLGPTTVYYDGGNSGRIAYDGTVSPTTVYDTGWVRTESGSEIAPSAMRPPFLGFCDFLAAKTAPKPRLPGATLDPLTGQPVGRLVGSQSGPPMVEPLGGRTVAAGKGGVDTHTLYPNGANYQRLNPVGHSSNPTPHAHGHAPGTGPYMSGQGPSLDTSGNIVPWNSPGAHWPFP